ncbi:hypothetical protein FRB90_003897 [Tulasnella sp. 427]|nr:hypothetical protein FRB90_003897 [Tulasnella sp. 427]
MSFSSFGDIDTFAERGLVFSPEVSLVDIGEPDRNAVQSAINRKIFMGRPPQYVSFYYRTKTTSVLHYTMVFSDVGTPRSILRQFKEISKSPKSSFLRIKSNAGEVGWSLRPLSSEPEKIIQGLIKRKESGADGVESSLRHWIHPYLSALEVGFGYDPFSKELKGVPSARYLEDRAVIFTKDINAPARVNTPDRVKRDFFPYACPPTLNLWVKWAPTVDVVVIFEDLDTATAYKARYGRDPHSSGWLCRALNRKNTNRGAVTSGAAPEDQVPWIQQLFAERHAFRFSVPDGEREPLRYSKTSGSASASSETHPDWRALQVQCKYLNLDMVEEVKYRKEESALQERYNKDERKAAILQLTQIVDRGLRRAQKVDPDVEKGFEVEDVDEDSMDINEVCDWLLQQTVKANENAGRSRDARQSLLETLAELKSAIDELTGGIEALEQEDKEWKQDEEDDS